MIRSVLDSEIYATVHGLNSRIVIKNTIDGIMKQLKLPQIPLILCIDLRLLYDCPIKIGTTNEKRLMIDLIALRKSYEQRETEEIRWITGLNNPAYLMAKITPCGALKTFLKSSMLTVEVDGWVERNDMIIQGSVSPEAHLEK